MEAKIGISKEDKQFVSDQLAKVLADEYVLLTKTKRAHWNVEGEGFLAVHRMFDE